MPSHCNVILLSIDALRPDHLGTYGADKAKTPFIDAIADEGNVFNNAFGSSCLTPIAHGTILSGLNPPGHGVRGPFDEVEAPLISERLKKEGFETAGFTGVGFLGSQYGFNKGFDHFNEVTPKIAWGSKDYEVKGKNLTCWFGNYWWDDMIAWLKAHQKDRFFIFGHYFEVHYGAEEQLLKKGSLSPDYLPDFAYYDAKIEYMDTHLIGPLVDCLKTAGIWDNTVIVITADHGENIGELPVTPEFYPQHRTLYECDLRIPLIIKAPSLPEGGHIDALARSIDIVPTIYDCLGFNAAGLDGISLLERIGSNKEDSLIAYAEELYPLRGTGDWQAVRSTQYKYIMDRRSQKEQFFHILSDPAEKNNLMSSLNKDEAGLVHEWRRLCDRYLPQDRRPYTRTTT